MIMNRLPCTLRTSSSDANTNINIQQTQLNSIPFSFSLGLRHCEIHLNEHTPPSLLRFIGIVMNYGELLYHPLPHS